MGRISTETLTVGILALLFALVGAYLLRQYMTRESAPPPPRRTRVPLAAVDLPVGKRIAVGDIILVPMTDQEMRERQFRLDYTMLRPSQIIGRILRDPIQGGDPFEITRFYPVGQGPSLYDKIRPGYRAVTINVQRTDAVGGFASPGSLVDILFLPSGGPRNQRRLYTVLEAVEVLAINGDQFASGDEVRPETVTLMVTPEEAQEVRVVEQYGNLTMMLRNPDEPIVPVANVGKTYEEVLGIERKAPPRQPVFRTVIYRGGRPNVNEFPVGRPIDPGVQELLDTVRASGQLERFLPGRRREAPPEDEGELERAEPEVPPYLRGSDEPETTRVSDEAPANGGENGNGSTNGNGGQATPNDSMGPIDLDRVLNGMRAGGSRDRGN